jgi:hypothetical protein
VDNVTIHAAADADFYRFTTVATGTQANSVRIQFRHADGNLDVQLLAADGTTVLATSAGSADTESVSLAGRAAGTYFVRVFGAAGATGAYTLTADAPTAAAAPDAWTVLVYVTASDLRTFAFDDINEMEVAALNMPGSNIAVLYDQSARFTTYPTGNGTQAPWGTTGRAVIAGDGNRQGIATTFEVLPEQNTGDPNTLRDFIQWAVQAAPAQRYALVMWDHGAGLGGSNFDDSDNVATDSLSTPELVAALTGAAARMSVVAFDACQMAMTEVGYALRNLCDVFVGAQANIDGPGYDYTTAFNTLQSNPVATTPEGFATGLVQHRGHRV